MRISIALILVVTTVNVIGRPHNDGTAHTHSPVVAPDSESVISIEGHNEAAVHHSDVDLGNHTKSGQTDLSHLASAQSEIAAAETHHSDTYLNSGPDAHTTLKPKPTVGSGHAPIIHVDNSGKSGDHLTLEGKTSVVSHGPMAKNIDNPEKKHNTDNEHEHGRHGHHDKHSTVNHAPMATEHHPKTGSAHHPQLSKTDPAIGHAPMVHPDDDHKDKTDDSLNEHSAVTSTVNHPPLATDHNSAKAILAHHPSLSKIDTPLSHAPLAIPHNEKPDETGSRKKRSKGSNQNSQAKRRTTTSTTTTVAPRESGEDYTDSDEYPSKEEPVREKRSKGSNQKSYARKSPTTTTTTTTTTTLATPTEHDSSDPTLIDSSEEHESLEKESEGSEVREKRSKGSNQKSYVKKTTTTTTTTPAAPTPKETFEASHRGSSEEQDDEKIREKKTRIPEESEFREKRSKGSNRKAYSRTTPHTTTQSTTTLESTAASDISSLKATAIIESTAHPESHEQIKDDGSPFSPKRDKRAKGSQGSQRKSYARTTPTTTTVVTTTVAPTSQDSSDTTLLDSTEESETSLEPKEAESRSRRSHNKGGNNHFAKNALTTRNYPTLSSSTLDVEKSETEEASEHKVGLESDDIVVRHKRSKGNYQKQAPRKTTTTTTTAKPTTAVALNTTDVSEMASESSSESVSLEDVEVSLEKTIRDKRSKGSNQNSYAKKHHITTTIAPKAPEPEVPTSNVHHPSLSKTEPLIPSKPEEPKNTKPEVIVPITVPEGKPAPPPQIIPGSHPLAIPLPTNPPPS